MPKSFTVVTTTEQEALDLPEVRTFLGVPEYIPSFMRSGLSATPEAGSNPTGHEPLAFSSSQSPSQSANSVAMPPSNRPRRTQKPVRSYKDAALLSMGLDGSSVDHAASFSDPLYSQGRRRVYHPCQLMAIHQQWLTSVVYPPREREPKSGEGETREEGKEWSRGTLLHPYGRVPAAFVDLVEKMKALETTRKKHLAEDPASASPLTSSTLMRDDVPHTTTASSSSSELPQSALVEELLNGEGAARLLSHPWLVLKEEKERDSLLFGYSTRNGGGGRPSDGGRSGLPDWSGGNTTRKYPHPSQKNRKKHDHPLTSPLSLCRYYCPICAEGEKPCDAVQHWLQACRADVPKRGNDVDELVTIHGRVMNKGSRAYACLSQPVHIFRSLLQLSLVLESKRGSSRLRWITEQYPAIRNRILDFLCGVFSQASNDTSRRSDSISVNDDAGCEPSTISHSPPSVSASPSYVPLPPVTAHEEWEEMICWLGFDALRDNRTKVITDFSRHWKRRTIAYEQFIFFYSFRDHQPSTEVMNIITRSVKPGMVAMLCMNQHALQLLHHHEFFIPEDHYWDMFPYLEEAAVAAVREQSTPMSDNSGSSPFVSSSTPSCHLSKNTGEKGNPSNAEELYCKMRHIGMYLSATQKHLHLFSPVRKIL